MPTQKIIIFLLLSVLLLSCGQRPYKDITEKPDWTILNLPNGWTLQAPKNFKDSSDQGIDSNPGYIFSTLDSIFLKFDSGEEITHKHECDFQKEVDEAKRPYMLSKYKKQTGISHIQRVDTIGDRVASIITSTKVGKGITNISINDCSTGAWLGITGNDLTPDKQALVLEIFRTIRMQGDKK